MHYNYTVNSEDALQLQCKQRIQPHCKQFYLECFLIELPGNTEHVSRFVSWINVNASICSPLSMCLLLRLKQIVLYHCPLASLVIRRPNHLSHASIIYLTRQSLILRVNHLSNALIIYPTCQSFILQVNHLSYVSIIYLMLQSFIRSKSNFRHVNKLALYQK